MNGTQSLSSLLYAKLKAKKILSLGEIWQLAEEHHFKQSTVERKLRYNGKRTIPCIPLNSKKKPLEHKNQTIYFWQWTGSNV